MEILIRDARFWVALLLLIRSVMFYVVPAFPEQMWVAIETFVGVVLGFWRGTTSFRRGGGTRPRRGRSASSRHGGAPYAGAPRSAGVPPSLGTCWVHLGVPQPFIPRSHSPSPTGAGGHCDGGHLAGG